MTKEEFIKKWCMQSSPEHGNALFDCSLALEIDLNGQLAEKDKEIEQLERFITINTDLDKARIKELESQLKAAEERIALLKACRDYDASGKNRPEGYIVADHHTASRIDEMNT